MFNIQIYIYIYMSFELIHCSFSDSTEYEGEVDLCCSTPPSQLTQCTEGPRLHRLKLNL